MWPKRSRISSMPRKKIILFFKITVYIVLLTYFIMYFFKFQESS